MNSFICTYIIPINFTHHVLQLTFRQQLSNQSISTLKKTEVLIFFFALPIRLTDYNGTQNCNQQTLHDLQLLPWLKATKPVYYCLLTVCPVL